MRIIKLKKIIFLFLGIIMIGLFVFFAWWSFFFFPDDYDQLRREALQPSKVTISEKLEFSLLDRLDQANFQGDLSKDRIVDLTNYLKWKGYLLKKDSYSTSKRDYLLFRAGTGLSGVWINERAALIMPAQTEVSFPITVKKKFRLDFSGLGFGASGLLEARIISSNGLLLWQKDFLLPPYQPPFNSNDVKSVWNNRGFPKALISTQWHDYEIDLAAMIGQKVLVSFSYKGQSPQDVFFLAQPNVFSPIAKRRYNVIYLLFDGVTTKSWSFYNEASNLTPFMKKVAEKDFIVFDNMISLGDKTRISTSGLFTSHLPPQTRHGINRNVIPEEEKEIFYQTVKEGELTTLPKEFHSRGYLTEQFGNNGFGVHLSGIGLDYGFDRSYDFSYNPYDSYGITHSFFNFLQQNNQKEFFVYLHYNTPHKPFYAPLGNYIEGIFKAPLSALWRPLFMGCINYTDDIFRNIYLALEQNNLLDNSIIIVATDHGAGYDSQKFDSGFQYNDYTKMTFMIHLPPDLKKDLAISKKRLRTYISSIHTAPTLIDLIGSCPVAQFKGRSFKELLSDSNSASFFDEYTWCFGRKAFSLVRDDYYKYIITFPDAKRFVSRDYLFFGKAKEIPYEQLYNLENDPAETRNLIHEKDNILKEFRTYLLEHPFQHPERTILSFFNSEGDANTFSGKIVSDSPLRYLDLYNKKLEKKNDRLKITKSMGSEGKFEYFFSFNLKERLNHLIFETKADRAPLQIELKKNGQMIKDRMISGTQLDLNIFSNPIILNENKDFLILNKVIPPFEAKNKELVKISRIDLHRWIDFIQSNFKERLKMSVGMKETLKSWGYIQ
jgi:arylsulfatase A-like enzyme